MNIAIGKEYVITSDPLNVILNKKYVKKDKDENIVDENALKPIGYYPNLEKALVGLLTKDINSMDAGHLNELIGFIRQTERNIIEAVKGL